MGDTDHAPEETQITCRFTTELPEEYHVPLSAVVPPPSAALPGYLAQEHAVLRE